MQYNLPTDAIFVASCAMANNRPSAIVALLADHDGNNTVWTALDQRGIRHDVPLLDDATGTYPGGDRQAFRVATAIAKQAAVTEPCCC